MPYGLKQPCRGGCGGLVPSGYCDACRAAGKARDPRPSAAKRGYGWRWQKTSQARLKQHPLCVDPYGRHQGRLVPATVTDHIEAHKGDMKLFWDPNNWQSLCTGCNSYKAALEEGGFGR